MNLTETKLKQIIQEELDSLINENRTIPSGRKIADKLRLKIQSFAGEEFTVRKPMLFPGGQMSQSGNTVYEVFWVITVVFAGTQDDKGFFTTRPDAFAVHITRALNEDTKEHELIIGDEVTKTTRSFPADMSTLLHKDPNGFWSELGEFLKILAEAEEQAMAPVISAAPEGGDI